MHHLPSGPGAGEPTRGSAHRSSAVIGRAPDRAGYSVATGVAVTVMGGSWSPRVRCLFKIPSERTGRKARLPATKWPCNLGVNPTAAPADTGRVSFRHDHPEHRRGASECRENHLIHETCP